MNTLFRTLGFNDNESNVYLSLADMGRSSAAMLAKRVDIPRTTAYSVLESLVGKGLVSREESRGVSRYIANPPSAITRWIDAQRSALTQQEQTAKELITLLGPHFKSKNFSVPRLQFFDGKKNVEAMLYEFTPIWRESIKTEDYTWWGYQDPSILSEYRKWLDETWTSCVPEERISLVSNPAAVEDELRGKVPGRQIKVLQKNANFSSTIWILGQYIVMIFTKEKPHYAFQLHDAVFASNLRSVFQILWDIAE